MHAPVAGRIVFSPSDLITFLESPFASWMDRLALERPGTATPDGEGATARLVMDMGLEHERRFVETLRAQGKDVVDVAAAPDRFAATLEAMRTGREVIYQGALAFEDFAGYSDFLVRTDVPSDLGAWSYEVWDTKLARHARPYYLVQLCAYAEMLEHIQERRPAEVSVVLGTNERVAYRTDDYFFFYRVLKRAFLEMQAAFDPARRPLPEAGADHRRWTELAERILEERDHPSRVANITSLQVRRLEATGIRTMRDLADSTIERVPRMDAAVLARLRAQARLQIASVGLERPVWELVPPDPSDPRRGLALLPPASPGDIFFDMEGYPFAEGGSLEYLFGACVAEPGGALAFHDFWAHDRAAERRAFEAFVDWAFARFERDPAMHVYHYASYEVTALRRLSTQYATREREIDRLLRAEAFVDLYQVVRQALRIGEPRYSLKNVEHLYRPRREGDVATAADSVVEYRRWLEARDGADWRTSAILRAIRDYNRADCESTAELVSFLRAGQARAGIAWIEPPRAAEATARAKEEKVTPAGELARRLLGSIPEDEAARAADAGRWRVRELLAHLLTFHGREDKPMWWALFDRWAATDEELREDLDCLAPLERTERPPVRANRSFLYEYRFDPDQDTKLAEGSKCYFLGDFDTGCAIETLDPDAGIVTIKLGPSKAPPPARIRLVPDEYVNSDKIRDSIHRMALVYERTGELPPAIGDLLHRRPPRLLGRTPGAPVLRGDLDPLEAAIEAVSLLSESALCIQGPPGTGKTHTAARIIVRLIERGFRIGVASNSHKAILKLMTESDRAAAERGVDLRAAKVGGDEDDPAIDDGDFDHVGSVKDLDLSSRYGPRLVGGTAWAFAAPEAAGRFDYLFVDEAGQVCIANLLGMAPAARNLVLMGDQMQLSQPCQGAHPGDSGLSGLEYVLAGHATIPPTLGIFLGVSRRLHPDLCAFISGAVYEDRLTSHPDTARLVAGEAGLRFVPIEHDGNAQASDEEVAAVRALVARLLGRPLTDPRRPTRPLALDDILIVAPYNMQVRKLKAALPGARIGSVDKFQGQEAPVVIVSMCASSADAGRGIDFLFSPNRLNVAISRAQCLAFVVGSPLLARTRCGTVGQMKLVNLYCRIVEEGSGCP